MIFSKKDFNYFFFSIGFPKLILSFRKNYFLEKKKHDNSSWNINILPEIWRQKYLIFDAENRPALAVS